MTARRWSPAEEAQLRAQYADTPTRDLAAALGRTVQQVLSKAYALRLHKSRELIARLAREHSSRPGHGSHATRFPKGLVPWNKGSHYEAGGRSAETRFQAGHKPHTWMPVGSHRIVINKSAGPLLERKVNELPGPNHVRWKPVHRLVWEAAHGPVPEGHIVVFKQGRRSLEVEQITLDAVELVTRTELMRRNTIHRLPAEFAEVARLRGVLSRAINTRSRKDGPEAETE